jgi:hypothetical protein
MRYDDVREQRDEPVPAEVTAGNYKGWFVIQISTEEEDAYLTDIDYVANLYVIAVTTREGDRTAISGSRSKVGARSTYQPAAAQRSPARQTTRSRSNARPRRDARQRSRALPLAHYRTAEPDVALKPEQLFDVRV